MRKLTTVFISLFMGACTTTNTHNARLTYTQIHKFIIGQSSEKDVEAVLGKPDSKIEKNGIRSYIYSDPKTKFHRLSLEFSMDKGRLDSLLWIPQPEEPEYSIIQAKSGFQRAVFKEVDDQENNPHHNSLGGVLFVDEKEGVTIRYDRDQNAVEAIAIYSPKGRLPADGKRAKAPYTLGNTNN